MRRVKEVIQLSKLNVESGTRGIQFTLYLILLVISLRVQALEQSSLRSNPYALPVLTISQTKVS